MKMTEFECVALKRQGAEYVSQLLSGMSVKEQLEFWDERTRRLISKQKRSSHQVVTNNRDGISYSAANSAPAE